jgi:uncharacterized protein YcaQ
VVGAHQLSRTEARRIAVRAQLLEAERPPHLSGLVRHLTLLQTDSTAAVARSADLVAWSRLGPSYSPDELAAALSGRELVELQGMIRPAEDIALYRGAMAEWPAWDPAGWRKPRSEWVAANDACRRDILARLEAGGPQISRDLPDTCVTPWKSSGWTDNRNVSQMLEFLALRGEVAVAGRKGRERLWDLASRVYPDDPAVPVEEAIRRRDAHRLHALGLARPRGAECPVEPDDVGEAGEPAEIEGVRGPWRVDPAYLGTPFTGRTALLSPLDRLIYDRKRMADLFEFDYQLEIYKPAAKRRWGYYALPILVGDRLVGKLDATADRKGGVLRVDTVHEDVPFTRRMTTDVRHEIEELARWLELDLASSY